MTPLSPSSTYFLPFFVIQNLLVFLPLSATTLPTLHQAINLPESTLQNHKSLWLREQSVCWWFLSHHWLSISIVFHRKPTNSKSHIFRFFFFSFFTPFSLHHLSIRLSLLVNADPVRLVRLHSTHGLSQLTLIWVHRLVSSRFHTKLKEKPVPLINQQWKKQTKNS